MALAQRKRGGGTLGSSQSMTKDQVLGFMRQQQNLRMLQEQLPTVDSDALLSLAGMGGTSDQILASAIETVGAIEIARAAEEMRDWDDDTQRSEWASFAPAKQAALRAQGYEPPGAPGRGFLGTVDDYWEKTKAVPVLGYALGSFGESVGASLQYMENAAQFATSPMRAIGNAIDQARTQRQLEAAGLDPRATSARLGLPNSTGGTGGGGWLGLSPLDLGRTWWEQGQEGGGADDILASRQVKAYEILEKDFAATALEDFNIARELAQGRRLEEIATDRGFIPGTVEFDQFASEIAVKVQTEGAFKEALQTMARGKITLGKSLGRAIGFSDAEMTKGATDGGIGGYTWGIALSGSVDAVYSIFADPTIIGGKVAKASKVARFAFETADDLDHLRDLYKASRAVREGATVDDVAKLLGEDRRSLLSIRRLNREQDLIDLGEQVGAPAERIAQAFETRDWASLARDMPQVMPSLDGMIAFDKGRLADGLPGMTDPEVVFDFYTNAAHLRDYVRSGAQIGRGSTMFGIDPHHKYIPTAPHRYKMERSQWYRNWRMDGAKAMPQGVRDDLVQIVTDAGETNRHGLGGIEVAVDQLGNWVPAKRNPIRGFIHTFTTPTPKRSHIAFGDKVTEGAISEMRAFMEMGTLAYMPRETIDTYFNLMVEGTEAQRALVTNAFLKDLFQKTGVLATDDGRAFAARFINHNAQAYGLSDQIRLASGTATKDGIFSEQMAGAISIPTVKEFLVQTRHLNYLRRVSGVVNKGWADAILSKIWKPAQLLRFGFAARAGGEESLSFILRNSPQEYFRTKIFLPWALGADKYGMVPGIETVAKDPRQSTLWRPFVSFADTFARMAGLGDEALSTYARSKAEADPLWHTLDTGGKLDLIDQYRASRKYNRTQRAILHLDQAANAWSMFHSKVVHAAAKGLHIKDRASIGDWLLGQDRRDLVTAAGMWVDTPFGQHELNQLAAHSIGNASSRNQVKSSRNVLVKDPKNPRELIALPLKAVGDFRWVTMNDPAAFIQGASIRLDHIANSIGGKEALAAFENFWTPEQLIEVNRRVSAEGTTYAWWRAMDDRMAAFDRLLDSDDWAVRSGIMDVMDEELADQADAGLLDILGIRKQVRAASDEDRQVLAQIVRTGDVNLVAGLEDLELRKLVGQFGDDEHLRHVLDPNARGGITMRRNDAWQQMEDRVYNALRRLHNQHMSRRQVRAMTVDGKIVADALPNGVNRIFVPMIDKDAATGIADALSNPEVAFIFRDILEDKLIRLGFGPDFVDAWLAQSPTSSNFSSADWMSTLLGMQEMEGGLYIPATLAASPNRKMAEAFRDAIDEALTEAGVNTGNLKPTIGRLDFSEGSVGRGNGIIETGSDNVYHLEPHKAIHVEALDQDEIVTMYVVQFQDGRITTMTGPEMNRTGTRASAEERKRGIDGYDKDDGPYTILRTFDTDGISEDAALRRAASDMSFEIIETLMGKKSKLPMRGLSKMMRSGEMNGWDLTRMVDLSDLPDRLPAPVMATPEMGKFERVIGGMVNGFFEEYATPMIRAISHSPQFMWNTAKASKQLRYVYDQMVDDELDADARAILTRLDIDPQEFEAFNRHYLKRAAPLEGDDDWKDYGKVLEDETGFNTSEAHKRLSRVFDDSPQETLARYRELSATPDNPEFIALQERLQIEPSAAGYEEATDILVLQQARKNPNLLDLSPEELEVLRRWSLNQTAAWQTWRDASLMRGYHLTIPYIDDSRIRSQFSEYVGPIIPFWYAEEQFLRRMARGLKQTPWMLRKASLMMNGMQNMGTVRTDEYGNRMFVYPGSEWGLSLIAPAVGLVFGQPARMVLANPLTSNVDYMLPGYHTEQVGRMNFGPIIGIPLTLVAQRYPEWAKIQDAMYGEDRAGAGMSIAGQLVPASMLRLYKAVLADGGDDQLVSATIQAMQVMESSGKGLREEATELERERYFDDVRAAARVIMATRALTGFVGLTTATPVTDKKHFGEKFQELLSSGMTYPEALDTYMELYEEEGGGAYAVFKTEAETGGSVATSDRATEWLTENDEIVQTYFYATPWVMPQDRTRDEFSRRAYNESIALKLRRRLSPEEWQEDFYIAQAAPDYFERKDTYDAEVARLKLMKEAGQLTDSQYQSAKEPLDASWRAFKYSYGEMHPVFKKSLSAEGTLRRKETVEQLITFFKDEGAPDKVRLEPMRLLLEEYDRYERQRSAISILTAKAARDMKDELDEQFFGWAYLHVRDNPELTVFWTSVIRPLLPDADNLERDLNRTGA